MAQKLLKKVNISYFLNVSIFSKDSIHYDCVQELSMHSVHRQWQRNSLVKVYIFFYVTLLLKDKHKKFSSRLHSFSFIFSIVRRQNRRKYISNNNDDSEMCSIPLPLLKMSFHFSTAPPPTPLSLIALFIFCVPTLHSHIQWACNSLFCGNR